MAQIVLMEKVKDLCYCDRLFFQIYQDTKILYKALSLVVGNFLHLITIHQKKKICCVSFINVIF